MGPMGWDELDQLMLGSGPVETFLGNTARLATAVVEPPAFCGITLQRGSHPITVAHSDPRAAAVDETQYEQAEGPCLQALSTGELVEVCDLATESRWPRYTARALSEQGVRSSLSLPLVVDGVSTGALNLYCLTANAFGAADGARAQAFTQHAAAALTVVLREARHAQLDDDLRQALASRAVIDQAIGVLMAQQRCDPDTAFGLLRAASQHRNRKLREIAIDLVAGVSGVPPQPGPFREPN
ncbi:MAG: GAF and ANTAR domain-containing protein [Acidothermaceae bacterium]